MLSRFGLLLNTYKDSQNTKTRKGYIAKIRHIERQNDSLPKNANNVFFLAKI